MTDGGLSSMSHPDTLKYGPEHEWSAVAADGVVTMGITDFAQDSLGDVQFLALPEVGAHIEQSSPIAEVESTKTSSDVYAPCSGEVIEANEDLVRNPERINDDPYGSWFIRIRPSKPAELDELLDAAQYLTRLDGSQLPPQVTNF